MVTRCGLLCFILTELFFQVEPPRCVRRLSGTRFALWGKWPESSQSSGLTPSLKPLLSCAASFVKLTLQRLLHASIDGDELKRARFSWTTWMAGHHGEMVLSGQWSWIWKHNVVPLGLMSWHRMSHGAAELHNYIRPYSQLKPGKQNHSLKCRIQMSLLDFSPVGSVFKLNTSLSRMMMSLKYVYKRCINAI